MEPNRRRQASLYLFDHFTIESCRSRFNPAQARLIPPHVTLCREDEVTDWGAWQKSLESLLPLEITLEFGDPVREENFVYLPVARGLEDFRQLRAKILRPPVREHSPHLTLIHPRNGICSDEIFNEITANLRPFQYTFREVALIEQVDGGAWTLISRIS